MTGTNRGGLPAPDPPEPGTGAHASARLHPRDRVHVARRGRHHQLALLQRGRWTRWLGHTKCYCRIAECGCSSIIPTPFYTEQGTRYSLHCGRSTGEDREEDDSYKGEASPDRLKVGY